MTPTSAAPTWQFGCGPDPFPVTQQSVEKVAQLRRGVIHSRGSVIRDRVVATLDGGLSDPVVIPTIVDYEIW
jgi:hypothetical protein